MLLVKFYNFRFCREFLKTSLFAFFHSSLENNMGNFPEKCSPEIYVYLPAMIFQRCLENVFFLYFFNNNNINCMITKFNKTNWKRSKLVDKQIIICANDIVFVIWFTKYNQSFYIFFCFRPKCFAVIINELSL